MKSSFKTFAASALALGLALVLALTLTLSVQTPAFGHGDAHDSSDRVRALINDVRRATARFMDVEEAIRAQYVRFPDLAGECVSQPGQGAMGIHYLNRALISTVLDPLRPAALMVQPNRHGKLKLLGVEYIVFQAAWDAQNPQPPVMFNHLFHLVRGSSRYGVPTFYELHLWVWEHRRHFQRLESSRALPLRTLSGVQNGAHARRFP